MGIGTFLKQAVRLVGKYSPQILTGMGIASFVTATVMAVEATPEAYNKIKMEEYKRATDGGDPITTGDIVKLTWKDYAAPVAMTLIGTVMIVGGHCMIIRRYTKQIVTLTTAYTMVADQANKYYDKTKQLAGKTKADDIKAAVAQDTADSFTDAEYENAQSINGGTDYFIDALSGRIFKYDIRDFEKAVNEFNRKLLTEMWKPVNELYDDIGLDHTMLGETLGYDIDDGLLEYGKPSVAEHNGKAVFVLQPTRYPVVRQHYRYM